MTTPEEPVERDPFAYNVELPQFEGPLDLLLHLIQKHELDILDIPMQFITSKYLAYLDVMRELTIDVASEYLVMAAVLTHIKSKMLLPRVPSDQPDELEQMLLDPREELVRRLLEYQKFKQAAAELGARGTLGADVFARPELPPTARPPLDEIPLAKVPVFSLLDAFQKLLQRRKLTLTHEVNFEKLTITDRISQLVTVLEVRRRVAFEDLFEDAASKFDLVLTFLALLEMSKMRLTRLFQADAESGIYVEYAASADDPQDEAPEEPT